MKTLVSCIILGFLFLSCAGQGQSAPNPSRSQSSPRTPVAPLPPTSDPSPAAETFRDLKPLQPDPAQSLGAEAADWYADAVGYHIWVNAFYDSDGSGVGDLRGITQKLDYLADLGADLVWLSPFFESSSEAINLHMYDTIDHYRVDPRFGKNEDVDELLREAHRRGIRVIFDWVPNHVSNKHPWFLQSSQSQNDYRDWFVWRERAGSQQGPWGQQVWHRHSSGFYYGVFWSGMPDINWRHQPAKDAMVNVVIHWLNRGFDGMRVDAVKYLYEDPASVAGGYADQPETKALFQALRAQVLDRYADYKDGRGRPLHKMMVAENWTNDRSNLLSYLVVDQKPGFHMTLDFEFAYLADARNIFGLKSLGLWAATLPAGARTATFLSNHDNVVVRPMSKHGPEMMIAVAALQLLWIGTPFIYYGNEVGMPDASGFAGQSHADRRHRQPMAWELVDKQKGTADSLWSFHKTLIRLRKDRISLRRGDMAFLEGPDKVLAFVRRHREQRTLVLINLGSTPASISSLALPSPVSGRQVAKLIGWGNSDLGVRGGSLFGNMPAGAVEVWDLP